MHDFLPENFSKVGGVYNLLQLISNLFFSSRIFYVNYEFR